MKPAAFLFDLDGTLVDTELTWSRAIVDFLGDRGVKTTLDEIAPIVFGRSWFDIHAELHRAYPSLPPANPASDAVTLRPYYSRLASDPAAIVIPTSVAFLRKAAKIAPVAIVSGSPHDDVLIAARVCGVEDLLSFVLGTEDYARGKPAPDGYLKAAEMLEADASECVVVEDSTAGVKAGRAAGMRVLGLDRNPKISQDFSGATWLVGDLSEIDFAATFSES